MNLFSLWSIKLTIDQESAWAGEPLYELFFGNVALGLTKFKSKKLLRLTTSFTEDFYKN